MRGLTLQSLKHCDKYNYHNQSLWLGINHCDRSYGTAIAFLLAQPTITLPFAAIKTLNRVYLLS
ncbi:hypothetical protein GTQ43_02315 [Nostoc sp. KVJ3]|uniref:hypothetical protein n=1 Tax=Nostoc sp. KVJ3 TaxID=457945 RepID=UPI002237D310|nr:hypothetical protein [Nostoc sp. KVJ3]MCW5312721.1 hypothetical protein [Nostoc sp. KVJ3]